MGAPFFSGCVYGSNGSCFRQMLVCLFLRQRYSCGFWCACVRLGARYVVFGFSFMVFEVKRGDRVRLLGIGGGIVRIPLLIIFGGLENIIAQGFSLIGTIPTAMTAAITKLRNQPELVKQGSYIGFFGIVGSIVGGNIAFSVSQNMLNTLFAILLFFVGINLYFKKD